MNVRRRADARDAAEIQKVYRKLAKQLHPDLNPGDKSAEEKFKNLKDGTINRHVYYACSRSRNPSCKREYINEPDLIEQFLKLIDEVNLDETSIKHKIKTEVARIKQFNQALLDTKENIEVKDIDIRNYAKYILTTGVDLEKRELLGCFTGKLTLLEKRISIT